MASQTMSGEKMVNIMNKRTKLLVNEGLMDVPPPQSVPSSDALMPSPPPSRFVSMTALKQHTSHSPHSSSAAMHHSGSIFSPLMPSNRRRVIIAPLLFIPPTPSLTTATPQQKGTITTSSGNLDRSAVMRIPSLVPATSFRAAQQLPRYLPSLCAAALRVFVLVSQGLRPQVFEAFGGHVEDSIAATGHAFGCEEERVGRGCGRKDGSICGGTTARH